MSPNAEDIAVLGLTISGAIVGGMKIGGVIGGIAGFPAGPLGVVLGTVLGILAGATIGLLFGVGLRFLIKRMRYGNERDQKIHQASLEESEKEADRIESIYSILKRLQIDAKANSDLKNKKTHIRDIMENTKGVSSGQCQLIRARQKIVKGEFRLKEKHLIYGHDTVKVDLNIPAVNQRAKEIRRELYGNFFQRWFRRLRCGSKNYKHTDPFITTRQEEKIGALLKRNKKGWSAEFWGDELSARKGKVGSVINELSMLENKELAHVKQTVLS